MASTVYVWHRAPFIRLLIPLIAGILLQWHIQFPFTALLAAFFICLPGILLYSFFALGEKYRLAFVNGVITNLVLILLGAILVWLNDSRHVSDWLGHRYKPGCYIIATLQEPPVEKKNTYKALAQVDAICKNDLCEKASGKIILYLKKNTANNQLAYGSKIIFRQKVQAIKNSGNPGSFDYQRYCLFQGITHQVYLSVADFTLLPRRDVKTLNHFLFSSREWVLNILQKFISEQKERGLAEALLIGYKDDLDKNLIQSYSNTGVVHVIAISGLHLGLIYWLLLMLTKPLKKYKRLVWLRLTLIISSLWLFSLLAGGQPSVLRSAVMFTCLAFGETIARKTSVYNSLALSAFVLLCINPYWLWDVGFQLSYAAVLSIIVFFRPIYGWLYFPNKGIDFFWKLTAVTIAAQLFTLPISIYHFHQLPTLFLLTNIVAVPLSSIILMGEIALCILSFAEPLAYVLGHCLQWLIRAMNNYIERLDLVSFSVWKGLSITTIQTFLLLVMTAGLCFWFLEKKKLLVWISLASMVVFLGIRSASFIRSYSQKKLIVYNVPRHLAVDVIAANSYHFIGDQDLLYDEFLRNFHLQPARIQLRIQPVQQRLCDIKDFDLGTKHISIIDATSHFLPQQSKQTIDVLILSKNPKLFIPVMLKSFFIKQVIIDASVPAWKTQLWKRDCDSLPIPCYDVSQKGAYVMNL